MYLNKQQLLDAVRKVEKASGLASEKQAYTFVRIRQLDASRLMLVCTDGRHFMAQYVPGDGITAFDVCVEVKRFKAAVTSCRLRRDVQLSVKDGFLLVTQEGGPEATVQAMDSSIFPAIDDFGQMDHVYSGPNQADLLSALHQDALKNAGSAALYDVAVFMPGVSYAMKPSVTVRCEASLVGVETEWSPLVVHISTLELLKLLGDDINVMVDHKRVLIYDNDGYILTFKPAITIGTFPEQAKLMFASLVETGHVIADVGDMLGIVKSAVSLLDKLAMTPLYLTLTTYPESNDVHIYAEAQNQKYEDRFPALSSGSYKIPIQAARLLSFLKSSCDTSIAIRVMNSDKIPNPRKFVHLVDSRLHEIIGIGEGEIENTDANVPRTSSAH